MRELMLAIDGLRERDKYQHDLLRRSTYIIGISGFAGKWVQSKFESTLWPVAGKASKESMMTEAMKTLKRFREIEDKKTVKTKLDARGA